ncbi:NAD(P)H-dependent oxidoreductase, partial [Bacteroidales bacterium OttesenSCG-928-E04]|nr:NAD(P)H-dependent oxidoreductase [Bacteroidales bacterium OttesenSCG-928-E04]
MHVKQFLLSMMMMTLMVSYTQGQQQSSKKEGEKKILVVYYSWSEGKNTETVARFIQKNTGGDIFEIIPVNDYPDDYQACVDQAKKEINEGFKPALKTKVENIESYDIIFIGTPNWWSTMAPPVATFLSEHNLKGKTVIP